MVIISLNKNKKNEDPKIFPKRKKKKAWEMERCWLLYKKEFEARGEKLLPKRSQSGSKLLLERLAECGKTEQKEKQRINPKRPVAAQGLGSSAPRGPNKKRRTEQRKKRTTAASPPKSSKSHQHHPPDGVS